MRGSAFVAAHAPTIPLIPRWLLGWWLAGRLGVLATAFAIRPSGALFNAWDGRWYEMVARHGYVLFAGRESDPAFFPLFPMLLRGAHAVGIGWGAAGPLMSNVALLAGLGLFYALTCELFSEPFARRSTIFLALFPLGYVFSLAYPESVVLVLIAAAPLAAMRGHWWLAAICGAAAALARPEGAFIALPLASLAWRDRRLLSPAGRGAAVACVLAPIAALATFPLYLGHVLNDPFAYAHAQHGWGRRPAVTGLFNAFAHLPRALAVYPGRVQDVIVFFLYLVLLYAAWRIRTPAAWLAAGVAIVLIPTFTGSFGGEARFGLLAPPLFWGLAALTTSSRSERVVRAVSFVLLIAGTASLALIHP